MSDLHLERAPLETAPSGGEVLALCGDIVEARLLDPALGRPHWRARREAAEAFLETVAARFDAVFYVAGNHEYYGGSIEASHEILRRRLPDAVRFLENEVVEHQGARFVGGALWSDFDQGAPEAMAVAGQMMSDFLAIKADGGGDAEAARFTPADAAARHRETRALIEIEAARGGPIVALTHHCPSYRCWPRMRAKAPIRHAFCSDLEGVIEARPSIAYWLCGHTHIRKRFEIGACEVAMNPRGYFWAKTIRKPNASRSISIRRRP